MSRFYQDFLDRLQELHNEMARAVTGLPINGLDWVPGPDMNSLAVLVIHATGAERYWIGDVVAGVPSGRDRDTEFRVSGLDETALKRRLDDTLAYIRETLAVSTLEDLETERVSPRNTRVYTVGWALTHTLEHTGIHLGHMQILRQLWEKQNNPLVG